MMGPWDETSDPAWERTVRVLIADDHGIVRSGLRKLLESEEGIEVVAEAADGERGPRPGDRASSPTWRSSTSRCPS